MQKKPKVIVICGPTASGKTALSIELAKKINGEIVSADSMQIYKEMDIGSAKPTKEEKQGIKHYMMDIVLPKQRYSVAEYKKQAEQAIQEILEKGKIPIIVGGTGLYVNSLIYGIEYPDTKIDEAYRKQLEEIVQKEGLQKLYEQAKAIDPQAMLTISPNDKKRIIRVLEIYKETGKTKTEQEIESKKNGVKYDYFVFAIHMEREMLYERINKRVEIMLEQGLIQEVQNLIDKYEEYPTAMQALGYKEIKEYLETKISKEEAIEKIKQETRHYAKRQLTWFRKNKEAIWLDANKKIEDNMENILKITRNYDIV